MRLSLILETVIVYWAILSHLVYSQYSSQQNVSVPLSTAAIPIPISNSSYAPNITVSRQCTFQPASVEALYFPPASTPSNSTLSSAVESIAISGDFTFTSPSIYLVYDTLAAVEFDYPIYSPKVTVGGVYHNVTIGYPPDEVRTLPQGCYHGLGEYLPLNLEDFVNPPQNWQITSKCAVFLSQAVPNWGGPNGTEMALTPLVEPPDELSTFDPAWSTCRGFDVYNIIVDPPRVLTPVSALGPTTTMEPIVTLSTATPQAQPSNPQVTPTSTIVAGSQSTSGPVAGSGGAAGQGNNASPSTQPNPAVQDPVDPVVVPVPNMGDPQHDPTDPQHSVPVVELVPQGVPIATVQGHTMFGLADDAVSVHGQTLKAGDPAITVDGLSISVETSAFRVGLSTYALPTVTKTDALTSLGGEAVHALPQGGIVIGSATVAAGDEMTIDGKSISVGIQNVVVDGITYATNAISSAAAATPTTPSLPELGSPPISVLPNGDIAIGEATMSVGEATTISGISISVGPNALVVGSSTYTLSTPTQTTPYSGDETIRTAPNGGIIIGSLTVSQGMQTQISGTSISVGNGFIVMEGSTYALPTATKFPSISTGNPIQRLPGGGVVFGGVTLSPNAETTISGTRVSLGSGIIVVNGITRILPSNGASSSIAGLGAVIASIFGFDPDSGGGSFANDATATSAGEQGGYSASGASGVSSTGSEVEAFTGAAASLLVKPWCLAAGIVIVSFVILNS